MYACRVAGKLVLSLFAFGVAAPALAQAVDVLGVRTVVVPSGSGIVRVPVYVHDAPGTRVGADRPPGHRISDIAFDVVYGPNDCVNTVFPFFDTSAGILSVRNPSFFGGTPRIANYSQGYLAAFFEKDGLLPFTGSDDDVLGELVFELDGCGTEPIPLVLQSWLTGIGSDQDDFEIGSGGALALRNGWIVREGVPVPTAPPTLAIPPTATPNPTPAYVTSSGSVAAVARSR